MPPGLLDVFQIHVFEFGALLQVVQVHHIGVMVLAVVAAFPGCKQEPVRRSRMAGGRVRSMMVSSWLDVVVSCKRCCTQVHASCLTAAAARLAWRL
jgi:hypothetical protein